MKILILLSIIFVKYTFASDITVSGISSGAYMAQQFHTAFSSSVSGAGFVAGGPYYCARGNLIDALNRCMKTSLGAPTAKNSQKEALKLSESGKIDPIQNLEHSKIWALSGTEDETVDQKVGNVLIESYKLLGVNPQNIAYKNQLAIGHAFPTENYGNVCSTPSESPYISQCGLDGAGEILKHLLGPLAPKRNFQKNRLFSFDQLKYSRGLNLEKLSMQATGYVYVPEGCDQPERNGCSIHIAFHGCKQTLDDIQTTFIEHAGYNEWAEANKIVILYPQAKKDILVNNPNGCWDWWGYSDRDYHTKNGPQMKLVMKLVTAMKNGELQLRD